MLLEMHPEKRISPKSDLTFFAACLEAVLDTEKSLCEPKRKRVKSTDPTTQQTDLWDPRRVPQNNTDKKCFLKNGIVSIEKIEFFPSRKMKC